MIFISNNKRIRLIPRKYMTTIHSIIFDNSNNMSDIQDESIDLVVTSPPYPMYDMWDDMFASMNPKIGDCLANNPMMAFELMHKELDRVWTECIRVLKDGGFMCINIVDAPRSFNGDFQMFDNHSRIVNYVTNKGLKELTPIIWKKPTNSPNKFMGSFLPCNGFVTSEHEYILIFKKGTKRTFTEEEKKLRRESAFFYEERNTWFSDTWNVVGVSQKIDSTARDRSAAFPLELPYRLIAMYSMKGDTVLDPFGGLQTTSKAAMLLGRHSIGYELDKLLKPLIAINLESAPTFNHLAHGRLLRHLDFIKSRECKYYNAHLNTKVVTNYETDIFLETIMDLKEIEAAKNRLQYNVTY